MANKIQFKRGIKATLPVLSVGEPALCTDTGEVFIGGTSGNIGIAKASDLTGKANKNEVAPFGFGLGTNAKNITGTNLNTILPCGWYFGENMPNAPTVGAGHWYNIIVSGNNNDYINQVATSWFENKRYSRVCSAGVWSPWKKILNEDDTKVIQDVGANYDLNNAVESSIVRSVSFLNFPVGLVGDAQGVCEITKYSVGWGKQVFITPHADYTCERVMGGGTWQPWHINFNSGNYGFYSYTADQTLSLANANRILGTSSNVIVPNHSSVQIPLNTQITVINWSGTTTFLPSGGVFIYSKDNKRTIDGNYASATLIKVESNSWYLIGALK